MDTSVNANSKAGYHILASNRAKTEARAKAKAETRAKAKAETRAMVLASLHDLATDCLRLSMHFFYPIQQCAQQVYHTAVPLSPTSSSLHKTCIVDIQISCVTAFSGAPDTWGLLLRTIDVRPRQLTCIVSGRTSAVT